LSAQGTLTCRSIQSCTSRLATLVRRTVNSERRQNTLLLLPMLNKLYHSQVCRLHPCAARASSACSAGQRAFVC
jgi:hypothetical protein